MPRQKVNPTIEGAGSGGPPHPELNFGIVPMVVGGQFEEPSQYERVANHGVVTRITDLATFVWTCFRP